MGKLKHGFIGPISGMVGNVVGSSWNGISYIKSRPRKRETPPTENELKSQFIFAMTQHWLKPLTEYLRVGFKDYKRTVFGIAAAKSILYKRGLIRDGFNSTVDPTQVLISHGKLPLAGDFELQFDRETSEICIRWNAALPRREPGQCYPSGDDQLMAVAYNVKAAEVHGELYGQFRRDGMQHIVFPPDAAGTYHVYAAFISADRKNQSLSTYVGEVVV